MNNEPVKPKKTRARKDPAEAAAAKVAKFDQATLRKFRDALQAANPTNATLLKGEKVELSL